MTATHLAELDARLGPVPTLSLSQRGLLPAAGRGVAVADAPGLPSRVAGALAGAAVGHALGYPHEFARQIRGPLAPRAGTPVGAEIELLAWSVETLLEHDLGAAPALAERLRCALRFRRAGRALPAALERLARGAPWFEAGVGSHGSGAATRAIAAGVVLRDRPAWRSILAGIDAAVTHASVDAMSVSVATADLVAALLALPGAQHDAAAILDPVIAGLEHGAGRSALALARERLVGRAAPPASGVQASEALAAATWHALRHLRAPAVAMASAVAALGDTDTIAALTGAFVGAANGIEALPEEWRSAVPVAARFESLATRVCAGSTDPASTRARQPGGAATDGVHVSFLLDRSGSMQSIVGDVIGGFNSFLREQQGQPGTCRMTLVQFDTQSPFEVLADDVDIRQMPLLDKVRYQPRASTPLLDAVGSLLDHAERRVHAAREEDQVVVVFTDGEENASRRWTREALFGRIERLKAAGWAFVFLGANQDSYAEGGGLGIAAGNVSNFDADAVGTGLAFASTSRSLSAFRRKQRGARVGQREDFFEGTKEAELRRLREKGKPN